MNEQYKKVHNQRILVFPFNLLSHYLRCLELVKQFPNCEIFFSSSLHYNSFIEKEGFSTFNVENFDPVKVMECAEKFDFSWLNITDIERIFLSQVKVIENFKPDFIIGDTSPTLKMACEYTGVKYLALMNGYMTKYYKNVRSLSQTHPGHKHLSKLPPTISNRIINIAESISFKLVHQPFKKIRRKYKLKRVANYIHEMEGDQNFICDYEYLFPQNNLPAHYKIIGPLIYKTNNDESSLISLLNNKKKSICVCLGSTGNWDKLQFLSSNKYSNYNIITAGDSKQKIKGKHIIARNFIALETILPYCELLVCHGGNGTIYHGIEHKKNILCLTNHFEQEWNVQQLEALKLGVGINANPEKYIDLYLSNISDT